MRRTRSAAIGSAVAVAALVTMSCASMRSTDWTNHNISEVIRKLGQPAQIHRSPTSTTYVWNQTKTTLYSTFGGSSDPHGGFDTEPYCVTWRFSVDRNGTIASYTVEELPGICEPTVGTKDSGYPWNP